MATLGAATAHLGWNRSLYIWLGPGGLNESMADRFMLASSRMSVCRRPQVSKIDPKNRSVPVFKELVTGLTMGISVFTRGWLMGIPAYSRFAASRITGFRL